MTEITDSVRPLHRWTKPAQLPEHVETYLRDIIDPPAPYPIRYHADEVAPDVYPADKPFVDSVSDVKFFTFWTVAMVIGVAFSFGCLAGAVALYRWVV